MKLTDEDATRLLEAMAADSAEEFENGIGLYLSGKRKLSESKRALSRALCECRRAAQMMKTGMEKVNAEMDFFTGKRPVKPPVDGEMVMHRLIMKVVNEFYDYDFALLFDGEEGEEEK